MTLATMIEVNSVHNALSPFFDVPNRTSEHVTSGIWGHNNPSPSADSIQRKVLLILYKRISL